MLVLILGSDWLDQWARKPFQQIFVVKPTLQDQSYRFTMAMLAMLAVMTYSSDWKAILLMAGLGYYVGAVAGLLVFLLLVYFYKQIYPLLVRKQLSNETA